MIRRLVGAAGLVLLVAGCSSSAPAKPQGSDLNGNASGTFQGAQLDPAQPRPQFTLTDTAGKTFAFGTATAKHPTLLFFGYTSCPDECPETMADARLALKSVPKAVASKTDVVFVTTDPKTDTPARIKQWLGAFAHDTPGTWIGLTGSQAQIDAAQAAAHVMLAADGGKTHSTELLLYGPDDYAHVVFLRSTTEQQAIAHDLPLVAAGTT